MYIKNNLEITQSQNLVINSQLIQSLNILHMNNIDLDKEIERELEDNPLLEAEKNNDINWEEYIKSNERNNIINHKEREFNDNELNLENVIKSPNNIYDDLHLQLNLHKVSHLEKKICEYIIDSLDKDGYLNISDEEIISEFNINNEVYNKCLEIIQGFDPSGVGARSVKECLIIQLKNMGILNSLLKNIILNDLELIASSKYKELCKKYDISKGEFKEIFNIIKGLSVKPYDNYSNKGDEILYIKPDVVVEKIENEFLVYLNQSSSYQLNINNFYKDILKNSNSDKETQKYIKEKLNSALSLINNIENRKNTILKIAECIVNNQKDFLNKGIEFIKPMTMKFIANELDINESTISRGVNGKYILTPYGTFELRYFFSSSINIDGSESMSSISIKKIIRDKISEENKDKPLSDDKLAKILNEEGINIARRTVAKYREELGILSSSKRKRL
ncbi:MULTISPECIES: RNA polymerase factor sigma-54 [unclassified Romboutsia]|uniref:RNA polymerase factor sigma-54 n=1 Tax=unclassified Romboutsia TaxID=2626894 RepID=UPI000F04CBBA|nr:MULTISPECIES: RNA polymerase factor sigma-54 [unclassified Romboutsia]